MKLTSILQETTLSPKQVLLAVQSEILEKCPSLETEMSIESIENDVLFYETSHVFQLKATMADLSPVLLKIQERENGHLATRVTCGDASSSFTAGADEHLIHHLSSIMIEQLGEDITYRAKYPADGIPAPAEGWIYKEVAKLLKQIDNGRLKSAADVIVDYIRYVPSAQSKEEVDEGVKQLEAKHDATIVAERKVLGRLYFILAKLS